MPFLESSAFPTATTLHLAEMSALAYEPLPIVQETLCGR